MPHTHTHTHTHTSECAGCRGKTPHKPFWKQVKGQWLLHLRCRWCDRQKRCPANQAKAFAIDPPELARQQNLFDEADS